METNKSIKGMGFEVIFNENSTQWCRDPEYNRMFIHAQQRYCNDMLKARGHVFVNEVFDCLGLPRTRSGVIAGWIFNNECDRIEFDTTEVLPGVLEIRFYCNESIQNLI